MDPLFWILAGIVVGCVIGIVILWRLEARAERRLAVQRQIADRESAMLKAIDPLAVIERADTRPIPATPESGPQQAAAQSAAAGFPAPAPEMAASNGASERITEVSTEPLPDIQVLQQPAEHAGQDQSAPPDGHHPTSTASAAPATTRPLAPLPGEEALTPEASASPAAPQPTPAAFQPAVQVPGADPEDGPPAVQAPGPAPFAARDGGAPGAPGEDGMPRQSDQELLQTSPERARLRAAELAREQHALEGVLEANRARLEQFLRGSDPGDAEQATAISLLRSEVAQQREHLLELIFLEQSYRQIAAGVTTPPAQPQQPAASPNTPRAFGVRRHPLARVESPDQDQPASDAQATLESSQ